MKYSYLFPKTRKEPPKNAISTNHKLLVQAGFIDQLMVGSWTLLPLGWRVVTKIHQIIREEINAIGGQEMLMPLLHPKSIWNETGRWDKAVDIMYQLTDSRDKSFALSFTHEEIVMDLLRKSIKSHHDLPVSIYHFSTKFRNELRAKSGILRGREFLMKDLYSAHATETDLMDYYEKVKGAYTKIFTRFGFNFKITEADGGVFTDRNTHEFQVLSETGEDTIYYCDACDWGVNSELSQGKPGVPCPKCKSGKQKESKSIEVGNIFPLGTWYAEKMNAYFVDENEKKQPMWFGSYGIGSTRLVGTIAEVFHDDNGIIWPENVAPYQVHLVSLKGGEDQGKKVYEELAEKGIEVLWDDRDESPGVKFADADLIGCPWRVVVSKRTGEKVEVKKRDEKDSKTIGTPELVALLSQLIE